MKKSLANFLIIILLNEFLFISNSLLEIKSFTHNKLSDDSVPEKEGKGDSKNSKFKKEKEKLLKKINKLKAKEAELIKNNIQLENVNF